jgi:hypothetical protein
MHRSGTSLVARILLGAGGDLGDPKGFYPPDKWNKDGYFEQTDIHSVNMALVNGRFGRLAYLKLPAERTVIQRSAALRKKILKISRDYSGRIVKENRFCVTLSGWRSQGATFSRVLVVFREPFEVARSLGKRNHIPSWLAYRLWCQHYERLESGSSGLELGYVDYNVLLDRKQSKSQIDSALHFMKLPSEDSETLASEMITDGISHDTLSTRYPNRVNRILDRMKHRQEKFVEEWR